MSLDTERDEGKAKCKCAAKDRKIMAPMDLLDEYWFFNNTLKGKRLATKPPLMRKFPSPVKSKELPIQSSIQDQEANISTPNRYASRRLLRTPSLPPPSVLGLEATEEKQDLEEEEEEDLNWSSIYEGALRAKQPGGSRSTNGPLCRAPSMPEPFRELEEEAIVPETSNLKLRYSYSTLDGHRSLKSPLKDQAPRNAHIKRQHRQPRREIRSFSANHQYLINGSNYYRNALQDNKKWKSSSDLESIEVQGFKDLGFVFEKEELKQSLANVLPGLRDKRSKDDNCNNDGHVTRPYLSEAWCVQRSAPPAIKLAEKTSATEMKYQLRFWARAVACNVRQEC